MDENLDKNIKKENVLKLIHSNWPILWHYLADDGWIERSIHGKIYYIRPKPRVCDLVPNINIFNSVEGVMKYIITIDNNYQFKNDKNHNNVVWTAMWPILEATGWSKADVRDKTVYLSPDYTFDTIETNCIIDIRLALKRIFEDANVFQGTKPSQNNISNKYSALKAPLKNKKQQNENNTNTEVTKTNSNANNNKNKRKSLKVINNNSDTSKRKKNIVLGSESSMKTIDATDNRSFSSCIDKKDMNANLTNESLQETTSETNDPIIPVNRISNENTDCTDDNMNTIDNNSIDQQITSNKNNKKKDVLASLSVSHIPDVILFREQEKTEILNFYSSFAAKFTGFENNNDCINGSLFLCGRSGTGKSVLLDNLIKNNLNDEWKKQFKNSNNKKELKIVKLNAMTVTSKKPKLFYTRLVELFDTTKDKKIFLDTSDVIDYLENKIFSSNKSNIVKSLIIEEMDALVNSKDNEVLYRLFKWANKKDSCFMLTGVSNTIELPTRLLPALQLRKCFPKIVVFKPYDIQQFKGIINQRIEEADVTSQTTIFDRLSIELCARKVAASSGDIRVALAICEKALFNHLNGNQHSKTVPLSTMKDAISETFGAKDKEITKTLPRRSKMILLAALQCTQEKELRSNNKIPLIEELYDKFLNLCEQSGAVSGKEFGFFWSSVELLQSQCCLELSKIKGINSNTRKTKWKLVIQEDEIKNVLRTDAFFTTFFSFS